MNDAGEYRQWWDLGSSDEIGRLSERGSDPRDNDGMKEEDVLEDMYRYY